MRFTHLLALALASLAISCSTAPTFVARPDGTIVAQLGTSALEDNEEESASFSNGKVTMSYSKRGKKQTGAVGSYLGWKGAGKVADTILGGAPSVINAVQN